MSNWDSLPSDQQQTFINIANKETSDMSAEQWFDHLVPEQLQGSAEKTEIFMNGGEVTTSEWVYDRGMSNGYWEQTTHTMPDRDVSRIESGYNGGEYTADNTIMEDASANRSRGAEDMTDGEYADIVETNAYETVIIDSSDAIIPVADTPVAEVLETTSDITSDVLGSLADGILPALAAYKVGTYVFDKVDNEKDKLPLAALSAGGATLATLAVFSNPFTGGIAAFGLTIKAGHSLFKLASKWHSKHA